MKRTGSPDDREKNAEKTPGPLGISSRASRTVDVAELLIIDVTASDTFEVRTKTWDKMSWLVS
jgi:hypothetical protein